jgi:trehalose 6-phosphate phosphatase
MTGGPPPALDPHRHALYLDFDGTLVDFAPEPDAIALRPGTRALLRRLNDKLGGALAIVSGRRLADIDRFLAPLVLAASGVHGQEFRPRAGGERSAVAPPPDLDMARRRLEAALRADAKLTLEDKGGSLVVHFRKHPQERARAEALARDAAAGLDALHVVPGHGIFEVIRRDVTKARALTLFSAHPPFAGRLPVYVGDDTTDEDAIRAAEAAGGFGVKVGPGETAARYRLADIDAVHAWLAALVGSAG